MWTFFINLVTLPSSIYFATSSKDSIKLVEQDFPHTKAMLTLPDLTLPFNNAHKFSPLWKLSEKIPPLTFHERVPENNCYITGLEDWSSIIEFHKNHNVSVGFWG